MNKTKADTIKRVDNHLFMQEIRRQFNEGGKKSVTFVVRGISMHPFIESDRDKVILAPPRTPQIGDVVLAEVQKETYALHRVISIKDGIYTIRGDGNPLWMKEQFTEENIVGVADAFIINGKTVPIAGSRWRNCSRFWKLMMPMRRLLLAIYRRI